MKFWVALALLAALPARGGALPALGFTPPAPGSYQLDRILRAPDGDVLDSDGSAHRLAEFTTGKVTVFSFIYTFCSDPQGCPLAYATLQALKDRVQRDPAMRRQVRFVSMSIDPEHDTPPMMRSYGGADARADAPVAWHFLTTRSAAQLRPLLAGFGQDVRAAAAGASGRAPVLSHLLKVYLLDARGNVREIYSPAFLHPDVIANDVLTLLAEQRSR